MGNYHYATITSMTWRGANILALSSSDGYCSFLIFQEGELGETYTPEGELAELMKVEQYVQKKEKEQVSQQQPQEQRVQIRQVEGGGTKKTIKPKILQSF